MVCAVVMLIKCTFNRCLRFTTFQMRRLCLNFFQHAKFKWNQYHSVSWTWIATFVKWPVSFTKTTIYKSNCEILELKLKLSNTKKQMIVVWRFGVLVLIADEQNFSNKSFSKLVSVGQATIWNQMCLRRICARHEIRNFTSNWQVTTLVGIKLKFFFVDMQMVLRLLVLCSARLECEHKLWVMMSNVKTNALRKNMVRQL